MTSTLAAVPDFDQEMETTRRLLAVVPLDRGDWKPHAKSTALGPLAAHLVRLASFGGMIASRDEVDMAGAGNRPATVYDSTDALLADFDAKVAASREAIAAVPTEALGVTWTLRAGEHVIFSMPRGTVFRVFMMNHIIHHRGQLSVYLRELDVPLPSIYGPTADS